MKVRSNDRWKEDIFMTLRSLHFIVMIMNLPICTCVRIMVFHNWLPCIEGLRASEVQDPFNNIIEVLTPLASSLINTYILPHIGSMSTGVWKSRYLLRIINKTSLDFTIRWVNDLII